MTQPDSRSARTALTNALREAYVARVGVPRTIEALARAFARSLREEGVPIEKVVITVKALVRTETARDESVFLGKVVGWAIAGYFAGTSRTPPGTDT